MGTRRFAGCDCTVMASYAAVNNAGVINRCSCKGVRCVADTAIFGSRQMIADFTDSDHLVMA